MNMKISQLRLLNKKEYLIVSSSQFSLDNDFLDYIALKLEEGTQIIQLNEKHFNDAKTIELGKKIRELCSIYQALLIVNSRIDIAQIIEADGIHLEENGITPHQARELLGNNIIIGLTTQNTTQIPNDVDYIISEERTQKLDIPQFISSEIKKN